MDTSKGTLAWVITYDLEKGKFAIALNDMILDTSKPYLPDEEDAQWQRLPGDLNILQALYITPVLANLIRLANFGIDTSTDTQEDS